jgi:hypothetical protein
MNTKKLLITFIVVFVLLEVMDYIIHWGILSSAYMGEEVKNAFRPEEGMNGNMWMILVAGLIWSYFFTFFFAKGYEGKGIMEGLRFGFYVGLFWSLVCSLQSYAIMAITFSIALQWFIFGMIEMLILGVVAALIYKPKEAAAPQAAAA